MRVILSLYGSTSVANSTISLYYSGLHQCSASHVMTSLSSPVPRRALAGRRAGDAGRVRLRHGGAGGRQAAQPGLLHLWLPARRQPRLRARLRGGAASPYEGPKQPILAFCSWYAFGRRLGAFQAQQLCCAQLLHVGRGALNQQLESCRLVMPATETPGTSLLWCSCGIARPDYAKGDTCACRLCRTPGTSSTTRTWWPRPPR